MDLAIMALRNNIDATLLAYTKRRWLSDSQNSWREFYKTDVISMSESLTKKLKELQLQQELIEEVHEMLNIFESMEHKVVEKSPKENIFQNEIDQLLKVSFTREIRDCVLISFEEQKNELLQSEIVKISSGCQDGIPERSIERRSFVSQPNGFLDPDFPNHAYHLKKALYGLKQAPRA
ncbi:hypothetical protein Tco_1503274 [Tanacetum coccineum]